MIKSKCLYCAVELTSIYNFPHKYCPGTNHKQLHKKKEQPICKCFRCGYTWAPRYSGSLPAICPSCKSRDYGKEVNEKPIIEYTVCHNCSGLKKAASIVCRSCRQPNTDATHYCGIPRKYYERLTSFLEKYEGNEAGVLELKSRLLGSEPVRLESKEVTDTLKLEEIEVKGPEETKLSSPIKKRELRGPVEKEGVDLSTLEREVEKSLATVEISRPKNEASEDLKGEPIKKEGEEEEEITASDASAFLDSLEWEAQEKKEG